jgi:hypothetical protein
MSASKPPPVLDAMVDVVLAYKPKAKTDSAKNRKKKTKKLIKEAHKSPGTDAKIHQGH